MGIVRPMLPLYLADAGLEPYLLGLVVSVSMIGMAIGESFSGVISDRFGLRLPLVLSTLVCGLSLFSFLLSDAIISLFLISFIWGGLRVLMVGPSRGYMANAAPPGKRASYIAVSSAILSLSRGVGALPGGLIVDKLGYEWVFIIAGSVAIIGTYAAFIIPKFIPAAISVNSNDSDLQSRKNLILIFFILSSIGIFGFLNIGILLTYVPLLATQVIDISATSVGIVFTVNGLATMLFSLPAGIMADRIGKRLAAVIGLLICAVAMLGLSQARDFGWLLGLGIVHALGMAIFMTSALGILSDVIPPGKLATAMGLYGGIGENVGLVLGSALGGFVWEGLGVSATFYTGAIACAIGILLCIILGNLQKRAASLN
jgi:MFS family permease